MIWEWEGRPMATFCRYGFSSLAWTWTGSRGTLASDTA